MYFYKETAQLQRGQGRSYCSHHCLFNLCFLYDFEIVVYSAVFTFTSSFALDKAHYQNVKMSAFIFTKNPDVGNIITEDIHRGGTR